jgi:hypothetical protein
MQHDLQLPKMEDLHLLKQLPLICPMIVPQEKLPYDYFKN